ncbi:DUF4837 family protein [Psychroserpens algicola]|uniref:DUF4837 family protein n=1 Tax=Psychroserpens algicola TaxID=1719034 RepID=A0ABT0HBQ4_9FLAO|nr:DUF4837 family protein [Psychroserpens algicola]MCK8481766.1 DUF4837 family protein [Psychroserpens algicola]
MIKNSLTLLLIITLFFSCNDKKEQRYVSASSGNINSIVVVADNLLWENKVGDVVRDVLAAPVEGLSNEEAQFTMSQMPPAVFTGFAKKNRTVLKIEKGKEAATKIATDAYARPQTMVVISGQTNAEIIDQINANAEKIIDAFKKTEVTERQRRTSKSLFDDSKLKEALGVSLQFPSAYRIAKAEDDFFWIRRDIETGNVDLMVYDVPFSAIRKGDSAVVDVVRVRDSVGKIHIEGALEGTYMSTEPAFTPFINEVIVDNKASYETRGLWDLKNAYMSGPFINYAIEDKVNNRYVIVEGYVFAPSIAKRDYIFELESIIKSIAIQ